MVKSKRRAKVVIGIIILIFIVLVIFLKMKYGTYGLHDFNCFFRQSKQEILEKEGDPVSREKLYGNCEDIKFEDIEYTFIGNYPESVRITDPDIRFGILQIGVGSSKKEVMLAYGLKETLSNEEKMNMRFKMVFIQHHSILMKMTEYIKLHVEQEYSSF